MKICILVNKIDYTEVDTYGQRHLKSWYSGKNINEMVYKPHPLFCEGIGDHICVSVHSYLKDASPRQLEKDNYRG